MAEQQKGIDGAGIVADISLRCAPERWGQSPLSGLVRLYRVSDGVPLTWNPGHLIVHRHDEPQFMVTKSAVRIDLLDRSIVLESGDAAFINGNVTHRIVSHGDAATYTGAAVSRTLLACGGCDGSALGQAAQAVLSNAGLDAVRLSHGVSWQADAADAIERLLTCVQTSAEVSETAAVLRISSEALAVLSLLAQHVPVGENTGAVGRSNAAARRVRLYLDFIEEHFAEHVSLAQIAAAGNAGESECLRCFKKALGTTPYRYLMEYRVAQAARLLRETDEPVARVSALVGFGQPSRFAECFKKLTGQTPRAYRSGAR